MSNIPKGSAYNCGRVLDEGAQEARVDVVVHGIADANVLDVVDKEFDVCRDIRGLDGAQVDSVDFCAWIYIGDCENRMSV
jgi:hypothetical protein